MLLDGLKQKDVFFSEILGNPMDFFIKIIGNPFGTQWILPFPNLRIWHFINQIHMFSDFSKILGNPIIFQKSFKIQLESNEVCIFPARKYSISLSKCICVPALFFKNPLTLLGPSPQLVPSWLLMSLDQSSTAQMSC